MGLEVPANDLISELNAAWPLDGDPLGDQNEHTQTLKRVLQNVFPGNTDPLTFTGTMKVDNYDATDDFTADLTTGNISRKGRITRLSRETAAAVTWTILPFSTQNWMEGDIILAYLAPGIDVTILPNNGGQFSLPDGTTTGTMEVTTGGKVELLYLGSNNWRLIQQ